MNLGQMIERHHGAVATEAGLSPEMMTVPSTRLISAPGRADSAKAVAYHMGAPTLVWVGPHLVSRLEAIEHPDRALSSAEFISWGEANAFRFYDGADHHLIDGSSLADRPLPGVASLRELHANSHDDRQLIVDLVNSSDPEDVEKAEIEIDDLDPHIVGVLIDGRLVSVAMGRPWDYDELFDDIGVLTHPDHLRQGLGSAAVATFTAQSLERGRIPLYRCNWSVGASKATTLSVGYQTVGRITALEAIAS